MKRKTHRQEVGEKLYDEFLSKPMGEMPSDETVMRWKLLAEQRRSEKERKKRLVCRVAAAVMILCIICTVCINVAGIVSVPYAEADNKGETTIGRSMNTVDVYNSLDEVPKDTRKEFLTLPETVAGYAVDEVVVTKASNIASMKVVYMNDMNETFQAEQMLFTGNEMTQHALGGTLKKERWGNIDVFIKEPAGVGKGINYSTYIDNFVLHLYVPENFSQKEAEMFIEKATQR